MALQIIRRTPIEEGMLLASNLAEDTSSPWSSLATYAADDVRHVAATHRRYKSVAGSNVGNYPPATPSAWLDIGPTNRWALFDGRMGSASVADGAIEVSLRPGPFTAFWLGGLQASQVTWALYDAPGGELVASGDELLRAGAATDWYEWTFLPYEFRTQITIGSLPPLADPQLDIVLHGIADEPTECAEMVVGMSTEIGAVQYGANLSVVDYSVKETDAFGTTSLTKRSNVKKLKVTARFDLAQLANVVDTLAAVQAEPIVVIADSAEEYDPLNLFGWCSDFSVDLALPRINYASLEFTGLT